jgi:hypothetical protein
MMRCVLPVHCRPARREVGYVCGDEVVGAVVACGEAVVVGGAMSAMVGGCVAGVHDPAKKMSSRQSANNVSGCYSKRNLDCQ